MCVNVSLSWKQQCCCVFLSIERPTTSLTLSLSHFSSSFVTFNCLVVSHQDSEASILCNDLLFKQLSNDISDGEIRPQSLSGFEIKSLIDGRRDEKGFLPQYSQCLNGHVRAKASQLVAFVAYAHVY